MEGINEPLMPQELPFETIEELLDVLNQCSEDAYGKSFHFGKCILLLTKTIKELKDHVKI